jgi:hypothetical protein
LNQTNKDFQLQIEEDLRTRFGDLLTNFEGRITIINHIMRLCSMNHPHAAAHLVRQLFSEELSERDPIRRDLIELKLNVCSCFLRSLVFYNSHENVSVFVDEYGLGDQHNLKRMLFHSLHSLPDENAFRIMQRLGKANLKWSFFYPLFVHEARKLDQKGTLASIVYKKLVQKRLFVFVCSDQRLRYRSRHESFASTNQSRNRIENVH